MRKVLFTGWVIQRKDGSDTRNAFHFYRRDAIKSFETANYPWKKCYKLGWRAVKVQVCLPEKNK